MSLSDPIADMLTRIRNAGRAGHATCVISGSKIKQEILSILKDEGFIKDYKPVEVKSFTDYEITLKYVGRRTPVISEIKRISRPGRRIYIKSDNVKPIKNNLGISILSTSKGIMTSKKAMKLKIGGEVICRVS
ncbi:MAG: 30S ribosomal protein S8 [Leptospiraceae bacterium]|nr:30S ribosomal protein S8 [Leptospiraceae bacterium]MCP5501961.1 30S ribosomal protein S8 [Leptospiraceae bacterium]